MFCEHFSQYHGMHMLKSNIHYYYKMLSLSIIHQFKGPIVNFVLCKPELTCCKNTSEIELKKL